MQGFRIERPFSGGATVGFLYYLRCPISNDVRYVGSTIDINQRYNAHVTEGISAAACGYGSRKEKWIASLLAADKYPVLEVVSIVPIEFLPQAERMLYESCKQFGYDLCNATTPSNNIKYGSRKRQGASS